MATEKNGVGADEVEGMSELQRERRGSEEMGDCERDECVWSGDDGGSKSAGKEENRNGRRVFEEHIGFGVVERNETHEGRRRGRFGDRDSRLRCIHPAALLLSTVNGEGE